MTVLGLGAVVSARGRLAGAHRPVGLPRPVPGIVLPSAAVLGAPVSPVPVMATLPVLTASRLAVLPMAVLAMRLGMRIRPRRVARLAHGMRTRGPARIGRRLARIRVMAVR